MAEPTVSYRRTLFQEERAKGWEKGREEGFKEGFEEGFEIGRGDMLVEVVLVTLERRGVAVSAAQRERVRSCSDIGTLYRWRDQAITAGSTVEIFQE